MSIFEIVMLVAFGSAWPFSIYRSWKSRSSRGKSIVFLWIILAGYMAGVTHKLVYNYDRVIFLYIINFTMVAVDIVLYYYNSFTEIKQCGEAVTETDSFNQ